MALLQISEPGQAPDPHQRRIAVGIDLGTTHSLVAAVRHGVAECLPGEVATGGGGRSANGRIWLSESIPFVDSTGQRWGVELHNPTNEMLNEQVTTYVICASA